MDQNIAENNGFYAINTSFAGSYDYESAIDIVHLEKGQPFPNKEFEDRPRPNSRVLEPDTGIILTRGKNKK